MRAFIKSLRPPHLIRSRFTPPPPPPQLCLALRALAITTPSDINLPIESISTAPSASLILTAFVGLPLALWSYKVLMLIVFQRKIIYMGYAPPGSRTERLTPDDPDLKGLAYKEVSIPSEPGIVLRGYEFKSNKPSTNKDSPRVVIVYFQEHIYTLTLIGNLGNTIQRLPVFQKLINASLKHPPQGSGSGKHLRPGGVGIDLTIIAVPPRSYGLSTNGRPSQAGFLRDYEAVLEYVMKEYRVESEGKTSSSVSASSNSSDDIGGGIPAGIGEGKRPTVVLMGHSLGASIALVLLSTLKVPKGSKPTTSASIKCDGLIFENGFSSIPEMVRTLYPSKWLPYHYLGPFVYDKWDAEGVLQQRLQRERLKLEREKQNRMGRKMGVELDKLEEGSLLSDSPILFVSSMEDELVPSRMVRGLYEIVEGERQHSEEEEGKEEKAPKNSSRTVETAEWLPIRGASHDFAWKKEAWAKGIMEWLRRVAMAKEAKEKDRLQGRE